MKNEFAAKAIAVLFQEANRIKDEEWRKNTQLQIRSVEALFEKADTMPADNPPGKVVMRNDKGEVIALEG